MLFTCSQLCDEIDEHEQNSPDIIEEEKKKIPGIWMKTKWIEGINIIKKSFIFGLLLSFPKEKNTAVTM